MNREGTGPHRCGRAFTVQRTAYTGPDYTRGGTGRGQGRGVPCEPVRETNSMSVTRRHQCSVPHAQTHKPNGRGESGTGQVGGLRVNREGTEPHR